MEQLGHRWTDFHEILYLNIFRKPVEKFQVLLKSDSTWYTCLIISLWVIFIMENVSEKSVEKIKTRILYSLIFFPVNRAVYEIMWQYLVEWDSATVGNMAYANCMVDTKSYRHTHRVCNNFYFCTATMVTQTRLNFMLYLCCLVLLSCSPLLRWLSKLD
jgi:hypothetical protein